MDTALKTGPLRFIGILLFFTLHSYTICVAQQTENKNPYEGLPFKERIFFGGNFSLQFGNVTFIQIAPQLGYHVSPKFQIGGGPIYQYYSFNASFQNQIGSNKSHVFGGSTFARFFPVPSLFLQSSLEVLNLQNRNPIGIATSGELQFERVNIPVLFVGGGFVQRAGQGGLTIGAFYDLIQDPNSPYGNGLFISVGGFF